MVTGIINYYYTSYGMAVC